MYIAIQAVLQRKHRDIRREQRSYHARCTRGVLGFSLQASRAAAEPSLDPASRRALVWRTPRSGPVIFKPCPVHRCDVIHIGIDQQRKFS